jgi:hypothetical protein
MQLSWPKLLHNETGFECESLVYETDQEVVYSDVRANRAIELEAYWLSYSRNGCFVYK